MTLRQEKLSSRIREIASEFFARESNRSSLITITRASVSKDMAKATIYISVFPETNEETALDFCRRKMGDFRAYAKPQLPLKRIPFFSCELDIGEKNRQAIDEIESDS